MKIAVKINKLEDIYSIKADSYLLTSKNFSIRFYHEFSLLEIKKAKEYCQKNGKELGIIVNKIMFDEDLIKLSEYLNNLKKIDVDKIYFADFSVFMLAKKLNIENKMVFFHETFIRNTYDIEAYKEMGIKHFVCSKDMNMESIIRLNDKENMEIVCFGYAPIYYSKRKIVANFKNINNLNFDCNSYSLKIKELTRDEKYPIIEQNNQTIVFNSKVLSYIDYMQELSKYINVFIFDSLFFSVDEINCIIEKHLNALNRKESLNIPYTSLFLDKKVGLI